MTNFLGTNQMCEFQNFEILKCLPNTNCYLQNQDNLSITFKENHILDTSNCTLGNIRKTFLSYSSRELGFVSSSN